MPRRDNHQRFETEPLFELSGIYQQPVPKPFKPPGLPVWTDSKARLIERYLHYFVLVTRHGIYIDGFAGPQYRGVDEYAAKLVVERELERRPPRLRHFHLVDLGATQIRALRELQERSSARDIRVCQGDFNKVVDEQGSGVLWVCLVRDVVPDSERQTRTAKIMRFPQPHDPDGRPCLPTHHPRSKPPSPMSTHSNSRTPKPRTCWPTSPPSPIRERPVAAATP